MARTNAREMDTCCNDYRLKWNVRGELPFGIVGASSAISMGDSVYFASHNAVYKYHWPTGKCLGLPSLNFGIIGYALANVRGSITTIGGCVQGSQALPDCLSWDNVSKRWVPSYPSMQKILKDPVVVTTTDHILVAGGMDTNAVYVMDIGTHQWSPVASLPSSACRTSAATVHNAVLYVAAECISNCYTPSCNLHIYYSSLDTLLNSTHTQNVWHTIEGPSCCSKVFSLVTIHGKLLCLGLSALQRSVIVVFVYAEVEKKFVFMEQLRIVFPYQYQPPTFCAIALPGEKILAIAEFIASNMVLVGEAMSGKWVLWSKWDNKRGAAVYSIAIF